MQVLRDKQRPRQSITVVGLYGTIFVPVVHPVSRIEARSPRLQELVTIDSNSLVRATIRYDTAMKRPAVVMLKAAIIMTTLMKSGNAGIPARSAIITKPPG